MINFEKFTLENGLKVIFHKDISTPIAAINILYNVGAKDESPEKTGFAHLFEHLMFGGSVNIPDFDDALQDAGGNNNAFTNNDITNYYITIPKENIETALWLESDRMMSLAFTEKSLETQRSVVIEEYKQRYLNNPYGDVWLLLRPLAYTVHPYLWATIGKDVSHIENAVMQDVKDFFFNHYAPNNAIMCIAGDFELDYIKELTIKWFGDIEKRKIKIRNLPIEPEQTQLRTLTVERDVPASALYMAYHICKRTDYEFYATDLLSDILSNGDSSRLYQALVKENNIFSDIDAYLMGSNDEDLFVFSGKLSEGISFKKAEKLLRNEIEKIKKFDIKPEELQKIKNKTESKLIFEETEVLNKAMNLCYYELLGDASMINSESEKYLKVTAEEIKIMANKIFKDSNCSILYYKAK